MNAVAGWPLVGSLPAVSRNGLLQFLNREWRRQGDVFRFKLGTSNTVAVAHPDALERVLGSHRDRYIKGPTYDSLRSILGDGLISLPTGVAWRKQRGIMQPTFHRTGLVGLVAAMARSSEAYFDDLKERKPAGGVFDIHREMVKLTLDVVVNALFGPGLIAAAEVNYDTLSATLELVSGRANGVPIPLFIPTPSNRRFKRVLSELNGVIYRIIARARAERASQSEHSSHTLLDMLLDAVDEESGQPLSDKIIRDELLTLFVAGHETTALTLTWSFFLMEGQASIWEKLRTEADAVLGDRVASFDDLAELKYHRMVIDEVLRLRGPVALVARDAVADDNLLGFKVRKGDRILPYFDGVHRHPDYWQRPDEFWPERFSAENSRGRDRWSYLPFSSGPRVCIGNNFSLYETVLILSMIAQQAEVSMVPGQDIQPLMVATVRPSLPIMVNWKWRTRN